ncbi:MAG TPA: branched-chain amino acid aminotransferase [Candidatus Babeliales bacterium]|jgi:branched-chain amino acid aminotransferase|nr:branched-chain amino acid aminotransferase [Candidatus Babeliales bacterium]
MNKKIIIAILCVTAIFIIYNIHNVCARETVAQKQATGFGQTFTDHMFVMDWDEQHGWHNHRITAYQPFSVDPASLHMHYGQEIFEGMKAFSTKDDHIVMFRPHDHLMRFNQSARIMSMPEIDVKSTLEWLTKLIKTDHRWVPKTKGHSLYIRPTMIATEATINLKPSASYTFFILLSPMDSLYRNGFNPIDIMATDNYTRSSVGGVGMAKTGGNYAASMRAQIEAHKKGYAQVLWLDSVERKYVEEVGTMNIFFIIDNVIITPALTNTILSGITRKTVLALAQQWNMPISERKISIDEVLHQIKTGKLTECFGTGTAAGITPVGKIAYKDQEYIINNHATGPITQKLYDEFINIRQGGNNEHEWLMKVM